MIDTLINKSIEEVNTIYENFENMINEKEYDKNLLGSSIVYKDIAKQQSRKKCALLPWWGIKKIIQNYEEKNN